MTWQGERRKRLPPDWSKLRLQILEQHAGRCHLCGKPGATEVDHIRAGDDHSPTNLAPAHRHCHLKKSSAEGAAARTKHGTLKRQAEPHPGLK